MKSQVLHTAWCNVSGEAAGEIWNWSLLRVKALNVWYGRQLRSMCLFCFFVFFFVFFFGGGGRKKVVWAPCVSDREQEFGAEFQRTAHFAQARLEIRAVFSAVCRTILEMFSSLMRIWKWIETRYLVAQVVEVPQGWNICITIENSSELQTFKKMLTKVKQTK